MNCRKGAIGEGLTYFVFLLMLIMIAGGIYGGLVLFFGNGYDSRRGESAQLLEEVKDCFVREKFLELNSLDKELFSDKCDIDMKVIEDGEHLVYASNSKGLEFSAGVVDFKNRCFLTARNKNRDFPLCVEYKFENGDYILVGSSQNSRRIAA